MCNIHCYGTMVFDYLMANADRHFGNFGAVRNVNTLEWIGLAPVFALSELVVFMYRNSFPKAPHEFVQIYNPAMPVQSGHIPGYGRAEKCLL